MLYPLDLRFKFLSWSSQIALRDANGQVQLYVKQKSFKLKEDVVVYTDEAMTTPVYRIQADRVIDFSANYTISDAAGNVLGKLSRRGMRSIWRVSYEVSRDGQPVFEIREANPWVKVLDGVLTQIPVLGLFSGYVFHPAYLVTRLGFGLDALRVVKRPAFLEGKFAVESLSALPTSDDERLALLGILLMVLLERRRG
jgi:hypothetical protein